MTREGIDNQQLGGRQAASIVVALPIKKPPFSLLTDLPSLPLVHPLRTDSLSASDVTHHQHTSYPELPVPKPARSLQREESVSLILPFILLALSAIWLVGKFQDKPRNAHQKPKLKSASNTKKIARPSRIKQRQPVADTSVEITAETASQGDIAENSKTDVTPKKEAQPTYHQGYFTPQNPKKYRGDIEDIYFRSSWEKKAFIYCDRNPRVIAWASEEIKIPYFLKGTRAQYHYIPDLMIYFENKEVVMVEIKPKEQVQDPDDFNKSKWAAARRKCAQKGWQFRIWTEDTIEKLPMHFPKSRNKKSRM